MTITMASDAPPEGAYPQAEFDRKVAALRELLQRQRGDALALTWRRNFAWATSGGDNHVAAVSEDGFATLLVTPGDVVIVAANNECERIAAEEIEGLSVEVRSVPWQTPCGVAADIARRVRGTVLTDRDVEPSMTRLRARLNPVEQARMVWLGAEAARAMTATVREVVPGMSELEIAALLNGHLAQRGLRAPVLLVGCDERIDRFRHPIPTSRRLDTRLFLVAAAERWGLHVALTRMAWVSGTPSDDARRRLHAARSVERRMRAATRPGASLGKVFSECVDAYDIVGFAGEWQLHHQGGTIAYWGRETIATPTCDETLEAGMAVAWNPSITGVKVEDTVLVAESGPPLVVTRDPDWPVDAGGDADVYVSSMSATAR